MAHERGMRATYGLNSASSRRSGEGGMEAGVDFPIVCEVCLGDNPYVRMVKLPPGDKLCKVAGSPFQAFRWKAGAKGRWKETIISREVAIEKNMCQACLTDMTYGVPVGVREGLSNSRFTPEFQERSGQSLLDLVALYSSRTISLLIMRIYTQ